MLKFSDIETSSSQSKPSIDALILQTLRNSASNLQSFYEIPPFKTDPSRHTTSNVAQYVLIVIERQWSPRQSDVDIIISFINHYYNEFDSAKDISTLIHRLGKISSEKRLKVSFKIDSSVLPALINKLAQTHDAQAIGISFWGLGKLAKTGLLRSFDQSESLMLMIKALPNLQPDAQNIANSFWGLGKLAEAELLSSFNQSEPLMLMLQTLPDLHPNAQAISNTLWGLGKLADAGLLSSFNQSVPLMRLLKILPDLQPNAQNITNSLWGLGKLAQAGLLRSFNQSEALMLLINALPNLHPDAQNIANSTSSLGKLAKAGLLSSLDQSESHMLMTKALPNLQPDAQNIANSISGLGKLAQAGLLKSFDQPEALMLMIKALPNSNPDAQNIANSIWGLGKLAEAGLLSSFYESEALMLAFKALPHLQPDAQNIANTLWGLGKLAQAGLLNTFDQPEALMHILKALPKLQTNGQNIANCIWGLTKLMKLPGIIVSIQISARMASATLMNAHCLHEDGTLDFHHFAADKEAILFAFKSWRAVFGGSTGIVLVSGRGNHTPDNKKQTLPSEFGYELANPLKVAMLAAMSELGLKCQVVPKNEGAIQVDFGLNVDARASGSSGTCARLQFPPVDTNNRLNDCNNEDKDHLSQRNGSPTL
jgi:hypothetical protein